MSPSAEPNGQARVAVVGAASPAGAELRHELAAARIPGERVELYGASVGEDDEAVISEYDGEARLIQEPDLPTILASDVVFLCEDSTAAHDVSRAATAPTVVIDFERTRENGGSRAVHLDIDPEGVGPESGYVPVAHSLALMLAEILHPVERLGLDEALAFILRPAADFGEQGVDELREQVTRLLNFVEVPVSTFGRQLAFNILNQSQVGDFDQVLPRRIASDVRELFGWDRSRLATQVITAPIFYGHCIQLRVSFQGDVSLETLTDALSHSRFFDPPQDPGETPLELAQERRLSIAPPQPDGMGGFWIWAVAGEVGGRAAAHAVRIARTVVDL